LDIYDICKGYLRRVKGEPTCINILREVIRKRSLIPLQTFHQNFAYPYDAIHAHTVAQYSLSTLIMRLVNHYMSQISSDYYPDISLNLCRDAYNECKFGKILKFSQHINPNFNENDINITGTGTERYLFEDGHMKKIQTSLNDHNLKHKDTHSPKSFLHHAENILTDNVVVNTSQTSITPITSTIKSSDKILSENCVESSLSESDKDLSITCHRCKTCTRVTETLWGIFDSCLDCHLKRICSICGTQALIISNDGFPKCNIHHNPS
jgi:hypothetical protein